MYMRGSASFRQQFGLGIVGWLACPYLPRSRMCGLVGVRYCRLQLAFWGNRFWMENSPTVYHRVSACI